MTKPKDVAIKIKNVSKDFHLPHEKQNSLKGVIVNIFKPKDREVDTHHVLKDISFDIPKGEFLGIVGRNGSGKSTLLKIISEIYRPTSGSVEVFGKLIPFIELGVGFNPELTGRENVFLNGALLGFSQKEMHEKYDEIVEFAELEEFMDQKLKNYSSGMQVRLAFAVAIQAEGDILVLDEVLAVGDEAFQRKCFDYFKKLKKNKKTVVLVTHGMDSVRKYCSKAMMIRGGEIVAYGSPEDVSNEYSLENFAASSKDQNESAIENSVIKNLKATVTPVKKMNQKDTLELKINYKVKSGIDTRIKVSLQDVNRSVTLFATNSPVMRGDDISASLSLNLAHINDTDIKVAISIRDKNYEMLHFLPDGLSPSISLKRTDYPDPKIKTTWAVMFDRGEWKSE